MKIGPLIVFVVVTVLLPTHIRDHLIAPFYASDGIHLPEPAPELQTLEERCNQ